MKIPHFLMKIGKLLKRSLAIHGLLNLNYLKKYIIFNAPSLKFVEYKINNVAVEKFVTHIVFSRCDVDVTLPKSFRISTGGNLSLNHPDAKIVTIPNASQFCGSDAIFFDDFAFFLKNDRLQASKEIFTDYGYLGIKNGQIRFIEPKTTLRVGAAVSLLGTGATHWAHFLVEYMPKIVFYNENVKEIKQIVIEDTKDNHILEIIKILIGPYVEIIAVPRGCLVQFDELLYCTPVSYICNHSSYVAVHDIVIPEQTRSKIKMAIGEVKNQITGLNQEEGLKKLYIQPTSGRSMVNEKEIREIFVSNGYKVVAPHLLGLSEKIALFRGVDNVVCPATSGVSNVVFADGHVRCLSFVNFERCLDTYMPQLASEFKNIEWHSFPGRSVGEPSINSTYYIDPILAYDYAVQHGFL